MMNCNSFTWLANEDIADLGLGDMESVVFNPFSHTTTLSTTTTTTTITTREQSSSPTTFLMRLGFDSSVQY